MRNTINLRYGKWPVILRRCKYSLRNEIPANAYNEGKTVAGRRSIRMANQGWMGAAGGEAFMISALAVVTQSNSNFFCSALSLALP